MDIKTTLIIIVSLVFIGCNEQTVRTGMNNINWINFYWEGDSLGDRYYDKLAMNVPIQLENLPFSFHCQLDLGSPSSCIFGNTIRPFLQQYPELNNKLDTLNRIYGAFGTPMGAFKNINFKLDTISFFNINVIFHDGEGVGDPITLDKINDSIQQSIGVIGSDLFQDRILIIDFPDQKLAIVDTLNLDFIQNVEFVNCKMDDGRLIVPLKIDNVVKNFMFDTGSSITPILTTVSNWKTLCDLEGDIDTIFANAWGKMYYSYGSQILAEIYFNNIKLPNNFGYGFDHEHFEEFCNAKEIYGLIGNAYFFENTIVLDSKNKRFGIVKSISQQP